METIIFATKNKGKSREINEILADMNVNVVSMEEAGITIDVVEDGKTFEENSMKKAVQVMEISGKITLADDSGLEIDYLDKAPGIYSARFLGEDTPYPEKFKVILEKLKDVEEKDRKMCIRDRNCSALMMRSLINSLKSERISITKCLVHRKIC